VGAYDGGADLDSSETGDPVARPEDGVQFVRDAAGTHTALRGFADSLQRSWAS
jgi:hypothetical protein